jgi:hypothetical protein
MKQTRQFLLNLFTVWTRPIILFGLSLTAVISISLFFDNIQLENVLFYILFFSVLTMLFSIGYQLFKRQFSNAFWTFCALGIGFVIFFFFSIAEFWKIQSMPDKYADKLTIPKNIKIYLPSDSNFTSKNLDTIPNFQIYNTFQPGLYTYAVWTNKIESGYCYLKAFEVTHNDPLSVDELKERSKIKVFNSGDTTAMFEMTAREGYSAEKIFTIYEGDWDKPYAARFEVWFVPDNGGQERKLAEKNFKIEGWMR